MLFKYDCKHVSRRYRSYKMYLEGPIKQLWLCVSVFDFLISQIIIIWDTYAFLLCFHTQHANSLLLLIHVQVPCDLAITRNTCVNICSLNYLNLFLKYKIGFTCLVFVHGCVLDLWMLCLYAEWCFESLICWLDLCLSSLLVTFISMCFSLLEKLFFFKLDSYSIDFFL